MSEDPRARFEVLAVEVVEPVRRYLARRTDPDTAADVLAETLLVLWRRIEDTPEEAVPWSIGVARDQLANATRGQRRRLRLVARTLALHPPQAQAPPLVADQEPGSVAVRHALGTLRPEDAELLRLWAWEELDAAGIAVVLDTTVNAVAIRLTRARKKLRAALEAADAGIGADRSRSRTRGRPSPTSGHHLDDEPDEERDGARTRVHRRGWTPGSPNRKADPRTRTGTRWREETR